MEGGLAVTPASATAPVESYRFDRLADDLDELREHLGYETVSVLAHSMGGFVALEFALRHPDHCERLALVGTTPCGAARPMAIPTYERSASADSQGRSGGHLVLVRLELARVEFERTEATRRCHGCWR